jgi:hypothetical protein
MKLKPETVGFIRGGMLFLEPPDRWWTWQRDIWSCCPPAGTTLTVDHIEAGKDWFRRARRWRHLAASR